MNQDLATAAQRLADILTAENAALAAFDLPRAAGMLSDKQQAAAGFIAAQAGPAAAMPRDATERMARRLQSLAADNQALLERAIAVQGRVIGIVVRAAAPDLAPPGYGASGRRSHAGRPSAFAVSARA